MDGGVGAVGRPGRLEAVDLLRGLMVALMVLDHVREYFSAAVLQFEPTDMLQTTPALFVTRWVTHLCAPTFVLLSGLSVYLQRANGRTGGALRRRLVGRGAWLILLEVTLVGFAFNFAEPFVFLQVIWAIGFAMILLAVLVGAPALLIALVGVALVVLEPVLAAATQPHLPADLWHALFAPGPLAALPGVVAYPALPWAGILLIGYGVGPAVVAQRGRLGRSAAVAGIVLLAGFVVLRLMGVGDPRPTGQGSSELLRLLSFVNVTKYPPSPQYVLATLGTSCLLLAALSRVDPKRLPMLWAFGRAPFFTYVLHIFVIHTSAMLVGMAMGVPAAAFTDFLKGTAALKAAGWGFGLVGVYVAWVAVLLVLRPLAIRFARLKSQRRDWWLSYL